VTKQLDQIAFTVLVEFVSIISFMFATYGLAILTMDVDIMSPLINFLLLGEIRIDCFSYMCAVLGCLFSFAILHSSRFLVLANPIVSCVTLSFACICHVLASFKL
jgi:hypothetical protein